MTDIAIRVENLSKLYHIGALQQRHDTLRDALTGFLPRIARNQKSNSSNSPNSRQASDADLWALKDVSFEVKRGEVVGIIGRNGAGKSTLLKILSRITEPTSGRAEIHGRIGSLLEVGTGFHPELTGRENIYLNGAILGMKRAEIDRQFDEIVAFAEIERFLDTPVKRYSSGMYVRLAFAVAAHLEPEILLVDEVLAVGDAQFQKKCLGKMGDVAKEGRTVLFVSHNMTTIEELCKRVFLMRSGTLEQDGTAYVVISGYLSDASRSMDGVFDLTQHPARSSSSNVIIQRLTLRDKNGKPSTQFSAHDDVLLDIDVVPHVPIRGPRLALAVEDSIGRRITTVASYFQGSGLTTIDSPSTVRCTIPNLALGSGHYLFSVSIGTKVDGLLDSLDHAAWFEVIWRNAFRNGEPYLNVYGPVLMSSSWERVECTQSKDILLETTK